MREFFENREPERLKFHSLLTYVMFPLETYISLVNLLYVLTGNEELVIRDFVAELVWMALLILSAVFMAKFSRKGLLFTSISYIYAIVCSAYMLIDDMDYIYVLRICFLVILARWTYKYYKPVDPEKTEKTTVIVSRKSGILKKGIYISLLLILWYDLVLFSSNNGCEVIYDLLRLGRNISYLQRQNYTEISIAIGRFLLVVLGAWMAFYFNKSKTLTYEDMGLTKSGQLVKHILLGIAGGILFIPVCALVLSVMGQEFSKNPIVDYTILCMIAGVFLYIGVGVVEEIIFRGIILGYFLTKKKTVLGLFVSTIVFVLMHFITGAYSMFSDAVFLFAMGLLFGLLRIRFDNLWVPMAFHAAYDWAVGYLLELRIANNKHSLFSVMKLTYWRRSIGITVTFLIFIVILEGVMYFSRKKSKRNGEEQAIEQQTTYVMSEDENV